LSKPIVLKIGNCGIRAVIRTKAVLYESELYLPLNMPIFCIVDDEEFFASAFSNETKQFLPTIQECSSFSILHHAHLKYLLDDSVVKLGQYQPVHIFIIYYQINELLPTTLRWPTFSMEHITSFG
jgi:hypothetical protein